MKPFKDKLSILSAGILLTALFFGLYIIQPKSLENIELILYDTLLSEVEQSEPSGAVTIVYIDEKSLAEVGQWTWPRYKLAELLNKIIQLPVLSVAIDFLLTEPDRTSLKNIREDFNVAFKQSLITENIPATLLDNDKILSSVLSSGPFITGYSFSFQESHSKNSTSSNNGLHPLNALFMYEDGADKNSVNWYHPSTVIESLKLFSQSVGNSGFFNVTPEHDGVIRKVPLIMQYQNKLYPSLSLATLMSALQAQQVVMKITQEGTDSLILDEQQIPLDQFGNIWIHFPSTGKAVFQTVSAVDILNNQVPREYFENKIVLIGASAKGLHDLRSTPFNPIMPGVDIHATIIDNIIRGDFVNHPAWAWQAQLLLILLVGIISTLTVSWTKAAYSLFINLLLIVSLFYSSWWWLQHDRIYLSVFYPTLLIMVNLAFLTVLQNRFKEKRLLQQTLEHNKEQKIVLNQLTIAKNELQELSNNLEQQVIERTQSLYESNKKLSDSVKYASLIQHSIIPKTELFEEHFSDSFIIWQPKDIVGGDVYLFETLRDQQECLLMVIDCTGHGVPGAFVTMMVKAIEREVLAKINSTDITVSPGEILSHFNQAIKILLKQENTQSISDAGFDGGILYYNKKHGELKFSGAVTNLFIQENGTISIVKGNRHSIGYKSSDINYKFKDHCITANKGMQLYLTSDGFPDQKGGQKGFCFGKKRLQKTLMACDNKPMSEQKKLLLQELNEYQGNHERNDDLTFIGVRI